INPEYFGAGIGLNFSRAAVAGFSCVVWATARVQAKIPRTTISRARMDSIRTHFGKIVKRNSSKSIACKQIQRFYCISEPSGTLKKIWHGLCIQPLYEVVNLNSSKSDSFRLAWRVPSPLPADIGYQPPQPTRKTRTGC